MSKWFPFFLLFIGGIILTMGDLFMKEWISKEKNYFYAFGLITYLVGLNFLALSFKYKNIAVASVIFVIFNVVTLALASWIIYREKLTSLELIGLLLGTLSIAILEFAKS